MTKTALEIVQAFQEGIGTNETWKELMHDDITFKGPDNTHVGKEANIKLNLEWAEMVRAYDPILAFGNDEYAHLEGTYHVDSPDGKAIQIDTAELYEIKDGKIKNIRVYYDGEEFRKAFTPEGEIQNSL